MRLVTQKGMEYTDIPYERSILYVVEAEDTEYTIYANCNKHVYPFARYHKAENAEKVMRMLHNVYANSIIEFEHIDEFRKYIAIATYKATENPKHVQLDGNNCVFRFPQEDDL